MTNDQDRKRLGSLVIAAAIACWASWAGAQFSHLPATEKNLSADLGSQVSAHAHRSMVLGDGSNVVTLLTLENRLLQASMSHSYGDVLPVPSVVAGAPSGAFGVKSFDAARGGCDERLRARNRDSRSTTIARG